MSKILANIKIWILNHYTKTQNDTSLALKANAADVYTKTQNDTSLALKANAADVYTNSIWYITSIKS